MKQQIVAALAALAVTCAAPEARSQAAAPDALDAVVTVRAFLAERVWGCSPETLNLRPTPSVRQETVQISGATISFRCGDPSGTGDRDYHYRFADYPSPRFVRYPSWPGEFDFCLTQTGCTERLQLHRVKGRDQLDAWPSVMQGLLQAWATLAQHRAVIEPSADGLMQGAAKGDPEVLRRTQVQVELALRENRNVDAARLYRDALRVAPGWADGHYNFGLLLGDLELYPEAITEMRRYLYLSPGAKDARAVQDRIYEWEAKMAR